MRRFRHVVTGELVCATSSLLPILIASPSWEEVKDNVAAKAAEKRAK